METNDQADASARISPERDRPSPTTASGRTVEKPELSMAGPRPRTRDTTRSIGMDAVLRLSHARARVLALVAVALSLLVVGVVTDADAATAQVGPTPLRGQVVIDSAWGYYGPALVEFPISCTDYQPNITTARIAIGRTASFPNHTQKIVMHVRVDSFNGYQYMKGSWHPHVQTRTIYPGGYARFAPVEFNAARGHAHWVVAAFTWYVNGNPVGQFYGQFNQYAYQPGGNAVVLPSGAGPSACAL